MAAWRSTKKTKNVIPEPLRRQFSEAITAEALKREDPDFGVVNTDQYNFSLRPVGLCTLAMLLLEKENAVFSF